MRTEGLAAAEALCVHSLGAARWVLGDLVGADELMSRSVRSFAALAGSPERIPSPVNIAEMCTGTGTGCVSVRFVFEETLQPFTEISCAAAVGYALANHLDATRAIVAAITPGQMSLPTPNDGWDVRALLNHIISGNQWAAELASGHTIEEAEPASTAT